MEPTGNSFYPEFILFTNADGPRCCAALVPQAHDKAEGASPSKSRVPHDDQELARLAHLIFAPELHAIVSAPWFLEGSSSGSAVGGFITNEGRAQSLLDQSHR